MFSKMKNLFLLILFVASPLTNYLVAQAQASVRYVNNYEHPDPQARRGTARDSRSETDHRARGEWAVRRNAARAFHRARSSRVGVLQILRSCRNRADADNSLASVEMAAH